MTLTYCSECGKIISDEVEACVHCGCPITKPKCPNCGVPINIINKGDRKEKHSIREGKMMCINCKSIFYEIYEQCPKCGSSNKITANPGENLPKGTGMQNYSNPYGPDPKYAKKSQRAKCPTCGSRNIEKISLKNKVGAGALFGFFAIGHIGKTFKCHNCGYKW